MKYLLSTLVAFLVLTIAPAAVFAQDKILDCNEHPELTTCQASNIEISTALATVIQFLFVIAVVLALGFLVYGGIKWITSGGDKGGVEAARNMIVASIIGLIIVFLAYVIINLVLTFLTGEGIDNITIPSLGGCSATRNAETGLVTACDETDPDGGYTCDVAPDNRSCIRRNT